MNNLIINLPFPGFYESHLSGMVDWDESQELENFEERERAYQPYELRLDANDVLAAYQEHTYYSRAYVKIAEDYASAASEYLSDLFGARFTLAFESMTSPKFYNFETDRLFAYISPGKAKWLFRQSAADNHKTLAAVIADRFTSRSGFMPFYPSEVTPWLAKPITDWDHNELETLMLAVVSLKGGSERGLKDQSQEYLQQDSYEYYDAAVDWPQLESAIDAIRDEQWTEFLERHPGAVRPTPRCYETLNLPFKATQ